MAAPTGSTLALLAFLAVCAGNLVTIMGLSQGASFSIVNGGAPGSVLGIGVKVHCYDNVQVKLPVATLLPGESLYHTWPLVSHLNDIYKCNFELDAASGTLRQTFPVWKHELQGNTQNFLSKCNDCRWSIFPDGFYWSFECPEGELCKNSIWVKEYGWTS